MIELELVDDVNDCVVTPDPSTSVNAAKFTIGNTTNDWHIENFSVKVDLVVLDNGLQSSYDSDLLSGASFPIKLPKIAMLLVVIFNTLLSWMAQPIFFVCFPEYI